MMMMMMMMRMMMLGHIDLNRLRIMWLHVLEVHMPCKTDGTLAVEFRRFARVRWVDAHLHLPTVMLMLFCSLCGPGHFGSSKTGKCIWHCVMISCSIPKT